MVEDDDGEDLDFRARVRGSSNVAVVNKTASLLPVRESSVSNEAVVSSSSSSVKSLSAVGSVSSLASNQLQPVVNPVQPEGE